MRRTLFLPLLAAAAVLAAGCDQPATAPDGTLDARESAALAAGLDEVAGAALGGGLAAFGGFDLAPGGARPSAAPVPVNVPVERTQPCPKGGSVAVAGTLKGEVDLAARSAALETVATTTHAACAFPGKQGGATLTVTGSPNLALRATVKAVNGVPTGPQVATQKGAFTWSASDGRSGSCSVDVTSTFDPVAMKRTVAGTVCGVDVNVTK